ncbi:MAG: hypothetical protein ACJ8DZ_07830 [Allosphingosinicella sp.]
MTGTTKTKRTLAALDAGLTLFAGAAAAFFTFAMPQDLFEGLVARTGLARFVAAARPPLGADARWAAIAAAGLVVAALVWSAMKALDRHGSEPFVIDEPADAPRAEPAIRLRKADAHPDAPARAPILASEELGEPLELVPEQAVEWHDEPAPVPEPAPEPTFEAPRPLPPFLVREAPEVAESAAQPPFEPEAEPEPAPESASIGQLMQRFETGLARKQQAIARQDLAPPVAAAPDPVAAPAPAEEALPENHVGHRLRSAIAGLNKMSASGT